MLYEMQQGLMSVLTFALSLRYTVACMVTALSTVNLPQRAPHMNKHRNNKETCVHCPLCVCYSR